MPMLPDNPAARLYNILERLKNDSNPDGAVIAAWSHALETPHGGLLCARIGMVYTLPREIERRLETRPGYDPYEMAWWDSIVTELAHFGFREHWSNAAHTVANLDPIRANARALHVHTPEPIFNEEQTGEMYMVIEEMRQRLLVQQPTLDLELRDFILRSLEQLMNLVGDALIVGSAAVSGPLQRVLDKIEVRQEDLEPALTPGTWAWWEEGMKRFRTICLTVSVGAGTLTALDKTGDALAKPQPETTQQQQAVPHTEPDEPEDVPYRVLEKKDEESAA